MTRAGPAAPGLLAPPRRAWRLVLAVLAAFVFRPVSYRMVLDRAGPDVFPQDRHGYGLLRDLMVHAAALPILAALLWWIARRCRPGMDLLAPAATPARTALSWLLLTLLGSPTISQWSALSVLPLACAWPALLSALLWFLACLHLRAALAGASRAR